MKTHTKPFTKTSISLPAIEGGKPVRETLLPFSPPDIKNSEIQAVNKVLRSKWITSGKKCREFEQALCKYTEAKHAVVLSSATSALFLLLKINGIGPGDEVITTPYTFASTANVIIHVGAVPVFADIEEKTMNISPSDVASKITSRTRAVIPVHFAGNPADIETLKKITTQHNLLIIEDAAHAIGASVNSKMIGNGENPCVFSFHAVKNLTTAEGGAITTNNIELNIKLRLYSLHGQTKDAWTKLQAGGWKYDIAVPGYKFNMTDIQAAMGIEQLKRLDEAIKKRERIAKTYTNFLKSYEFISIQQIKEETVHAHHIYPILIDFTKLKINRDDFIRALWAENISSNVHFIPVHTMSFYRKTFGYRPEDFPIAYRTYLKEISLPIYPQLRKSDIQDILNGLEKLLSFYKKEF